jgi:hypothetical protein
MIGRQLKVGDICEILRNLQNSTYVFGLKRLRGIVRSLKRPAKAQTVMDTKGG